MSQNLQDWYAEIKSLLVDHGLDVGAKTDIAYGVQFSVKQMSQSGLIRLYYSQKKGRKLDLSQVHDPALKQILSEILSTPLQAEKKPPSAQTDYHYPLIGIDESGKGDYFGPLVVAGVCVKDQEADHALRNLGVRDSKTLSDTEIRNLAPQISSTCPTEVWILDNTAYNALYDQIQNLNKLLARGHATVCKILSDRTGCHRVLSDQFAKKAVLDQAINNQGLNITLFQETQAERYIAVAAASIVARAAFSEGLENLSQNIGQTLPKGAGIHVQKLVRKLEKTLSPDDLTAISKRHFKLRETP